MSQDTASMVKFMVMFHRPGNLAAFENDYTLFLSLVEQMPDILRRQVVDVIGSPTGKARYYRILEVYFDSQDVMENALKTETGQRAGAALNRFPAGAVEMLFADVYEEEGGQTPTGDEEDE